MEKAPKNQELCNSRGGQASGPPLGSAWNVANLRQRTLHQALMPAEIYGRHDAD